MEIFWERELSEYLGRRREELDREVLSADDNYLLNVNETEYIGYLADRYRVEPLVFDWDGLSLSSREEMIPAEMHPGIFPAVRRGERYRRQVVTYHLPFRGSTELLSCRGSKWIPSTATVEVEQDGVCFDIIDWTGDPEAIKREADSRLDKIRKHSEFVAADVGQYNSQLEDYARQLVQHRKEKLLKQANLLQSLGVPVRKAQDVPDTFAVPVTRKPVVVKPSAPDTAYKPEPALDEPTYQGILRVTHELGVAMERLPGVYRGKDEETLRDYFLVNLSPHFQSATGEAFNKSGKTDILIRHEKANVFVAECTFWQGMKGFLGKIDQALSYLTWRDSKAAILCFVKNKELGPVLQQIEQKTAEHPCFVRYHGKKEDSWFSFEFHLPDDHTRSVHLAIQCFHFPEAPG